MSSSQNQEEKSTVRSHVTTSSVNESKDVTTSKTITPIESVFTEKQDDVESNDGYNCPLPTENGDDDNGVIRTDNDNNNNVLARVASRLSTRSIRDPPPPPDGGKTAWLQCAMTFLVIFNTWGYVNSFGTFQTYYVSTLDESASTISWIGSVQTFVLFFLGTFSGRASDAGFFAPLFAVGAAVQVLGIFMTSLASRYWQLFLAQAVCTGVGGGLIFTPTVGVLSSYFARNRGLAVALATTGNSMGGALYPLMVRQMLPQIGFGWTMRVLGFLNLVCLSVAFAFMKPRLPPRKTGPLVDWSAFKEVEYVLHGLGLCFHVASLYWTNYYIASYGRQTLSLNYSSSIILLIILNGVGVPARVLAGLLADRLLGILNTFIVLLSAVTVLAYCWIAVSSRPGLYVFVCFYGVVLAAYQSLLPTSIATMVKDLRKTGTRLGMVFTIFSFAALCGPPLGGALVDGNVYTHAQVWAATSALVGTCLVATARVYRFGWSLRIKC